MDFGTCDTFLEKIPRFPYNTEEIFFYPSHKDGFNNCEKDDMIIANQKRLEIIKRNSEKIFSPKFLEQYMQEVNDTEHLRILGPICRQYGFELDKPRNWTESLKVLQIGCGPWGESLDFGVKLDQKLRALGAEVINIDIEDKSKYYPTGNFIQGSWLTMENYFKAEQFHVVFMDDMDPAISDQIYEYYKKTTLHPSSYNFDLLNRTQSITKKKGLNLFGIRDCTSFKMPENVNDVVHFLYTDWNYLIPPKFNGGVQIYKKRF